MAENKTRKTRTAKDVERLRALGITVPTPGRKSIADGGSDSRREAALTKMGEALKGVTFPVAIVSAEMPVKDRKAVLPDNFNTVVVKGMKPDAVKRWTREYFKGQKGRTVDTVKMVNIVS